MDTLATAVISNELWSEKEGVVQDQSGLVRRSFFSRRKTRAAAVSDNFTTLTTKPTKVLDGMLNGKITFFTCNQFWGALGSQIDTVNDLTKDDAWLDLLRLFRESSGLCHDFSARLSKLPQKQGPGFPVTAPQRAQIQTSASKVLEALRKRLVDDTSFAFSFFSRFPKVASKLPIALVKQIILKDANTRDIPGVAEVVLTNRRLRVKLAGEEMTSDDIIKLKEKLKFNTKRSDKAAHGMLNALLNVKVKVAKADGSKGKKIKLVEKLRSDFMASLNKEEPSVSSLFEQFRDSYLRDKLRLSASEIKKLLEKVKDKRFDLIVACDSKLWDTVMPSKWWFGFEKKKKSLAEFSPIFAARMECQNPSPSHKDIVAKMPSVSPEISEFVNRSQFDSVQIEETAPPVSANDPHSIVGKTEEIVATSPSTHNSSDAVVLANTTLLVGYPSGQPKQPEGSGTKVEMQTHEEVLDHPEEGSRSVKSPLETMERAEVQRPLFERFDHSYHVKDPVLAAKLKKSEGNLKMRKTASDPDFTFRESEFPAEIKSGDEPATATDDFLTDINLVAKLNKLEAQLNELGDGDTLDLSQYDNDATFWKVVMRCLKDDSTSTSTKLPNLSKLKESPIAVLNALWGEKDESFFKVVFSACNDIDFMRSINSYYAQMYKGSYPSIVSKGISPRIRALLESSHAGSETLQETAPNIRHQSAAVGAS